jgi:hypothetical protein
MSRMKIKETILLIVATAWIGCSPEIDSHNIPGCYIANHEMGNDTLFIGSDGSYHHDFQDIDGKIYHDSGRWEFSTMGSSQVIQFSDFMHYGDTSFSRRGLWPVHPEYSFWGKIRLMCNPDLNLYFEKK